MGPDKPSSFCNYLVEPHLPASCGAFTFVGRMRPRAKTSSREHGPNFDLVWTCEWLSYARVSGSQAYGILVRFFPLYGVYQFESLWHSRLWVAACPSQTSHSMFGVLFEELDMDMVMIILSLWLLYLFNFDVDMGQRFTCSNCRCKHSTWLEIKNG
jgi:hypothetical protein